MNRIKSVANAVTTLSVGTAIVVGQQGAAWLNTHQANFPSWGSPAVAVVLFYVASQLLRMVLELLLERLTGLRRFLLGDQFVEGVWFDLIFEGSNLISVGHSMIKYIDGKMSLSGEDFPLDHSGKGYFRSKLVDFTWPTLEYTYIYENQVDDQQGYGVVQFVEQSGPPLSYTGKFVNRSNGKRFTFQSFRVSNKASLRVFEQEKMKDKFILNYLQAEIKKYQGVLTAAIPRP
jgi:hypothetical protein